MSRRLRHLGLTRAGWLLIALVLAVVLAGGAWTARAQEGEEIPRYTPSARSGRQAVVELAEAHFAPAWVAWAIRVAACESSFDLYARSSGFDRRFGWYLHVGAFQISVPTWAAKAWELFGGDLSDPDVNFAMSSWIVTNYGPYHWPYCGR